MFRERSHFLSTYGCEFDDVEELRESGSTDCYVTVMRYVLVDEEQRSKQ